MEFFSAMGRSRKLRYKNYTLCKNKNLCNRITYLECSEWSSRYRCKEKQFLDSQKNLLNQQTDEFISQVLNSSDQNSDEEEQAPIGPTEHLCAFKQSDS